MLKRIAFVLISVVLLQACRTTEENYRSSYEIATEKMRADETGGLDRETYNKILEQQRPRATVVGTDSVPMVSGYAWQFYGEEYPLCKYNVVVGAMKQQFNAKAFCDRLRAEGCESYVMADRNKNYYIVAAGFNDLQKAADYLKTVASCISFKLPIDEPYIYDTARIYVKPVVK